MKLSRILSEPDRSPATVAFASELVVSRPNAISISTESSGQPVLNLAASCQEERVAWAEAIAKAADYNVTLPET